MLGNLEGTMPKSYVVTEKQALRIFKGLCNCAGDARPESYQLWGAAKAAFPGLWEGLYPELREMLGPAERKMEAA